jgi:N-hydroxyarylamine O-acetyltransferase
MMAAHEGLDLEAYCSRVAYSGPRAATPETLDALHVAHLSAIPFENLDPLLGRRVRLDLESLEAKLVRSRRGGYCFEHNTLFAAVLRSLGYAVSSFEARVRPLGSARVLPRTHMVLAVRVGGRGLLADVGFGGDGPLRPVPLDGEVSAQGSESYRVVPEGAVRALQISRGGAWQDLYAFAPQETLPIDFEVANHFTSTWPESPFVTTLTAQLSLPDERRILRDRTLTLRQGGVESARQVAEEELLPLLSDRFGIDLPPGTRLPSRRPGPG